MNEKLNQYLNGVFAPYDGARSIAELKADLLSDLQERFNELNAAGKDDETAFAMTISSKRYRRLLTSPAPASGSC